LSKRLIALLAAVLAIAAIAGCGGGDSDTETAAPESAPSASEDSGGPALTKAEFIEQGDAICKENQEEGEAELSAFLEEVGEGEPSEEDQERVITEVVAPSLQASADGLRELTPPEGEEEAVAEIVDGLDEAIASVEDDPIAALEGDPFTEVNEKAIDFGFKVCGEN
jgi:hypothetical protein